MTRDCVRAARSGSHLCTKKMSAELRSREVIRISDPSPAHLPYTDVSVSVSVSVSVALTYCWGERIAPTHYDSVTSNISRGPAACQWFQHSRTHKRMNRDAPKRTGTVDVRESPSVTLSVTTHRDHAFRGRQRGGVERPNRWRSEPHTRTRVERRYACPRALCAVPAACAWERSRSPPSTGSKVYVCAPQPEVSTRQNVVRTRLGDGRVLWIECAP